MNVKEGTYVEISEIENDVGDEASHEETEESTADVEAGLAAQSSLGGTDDRPGDNDERNPSVGAELFADETRG
jgi:hypothetical protein